MLPSCLHANIINVIMKSEEATPLQIEYDLRTLEYYSYLRTILEINQIHYWIGNPSVQIVNGSIHLQPLLLPQHHPDTYQQYLHAIRKTNVSEITPNFNQETHENTRQNRNNQRSRCLVLCGIPNSKSPVQILQNSQLGQYRSAIIEIRVIKTTHLKYYGMLLLFKNQKAATIFFNDLFATEYNEIEMQRMLFRQMIDITLTFSELIKQGESNELKILRQLHEQQQIQRLPPQKLFMNSHLSSSQQMKQDLPKQKSQCSICLQQISSETISILCGHYFHCHCLQRWQFNTCPLCRYHQQPPVISFCEQCNQCQGLWVCLICGRRLCCGVQNDILAEDSHIYEHYKHTTHSLSMQLETKFIFDARTPAFLHQMFYQDLIRKGVPTIEESQCQKQDIKKNKLSDKIALYENQVAEEMHKQRNYFEEDISRQAKIYREHVHKNKEKLKNLQKEAETLTKQIDDLTKQGFVLTTQLQAAEKEDKIVTNLLKIYAEKAQRSSQKAERGNQLLRRRLAELDELIKQKKSELLNYKNNLILQDKIKGKLKGETVEGEIFLVADRPKKIKKKT